MVDRERFERIKERHGRYASWAVWAAPGATPKSNIGDLSVLDPDRNPTLLGTLRTDSIMLGLNISRPGIVVEPFRNFHDASSRGQDYKIRYAFLNTPYWGAYMSDFIKDVVMLDRGSLMRYVRANPSIVRKNVEQLVAECEDLGCDLPTILTFGGDTSWLVANNVPNTLYSRLVPLIHYANYISQEDYRLDTLKRLGRRTMADKYASFAELAIREIEGRDFQVRLRKRDGVAAVIAPHGGGIEPGTSEVADAIAANDLSFYAFEGIKAVANRRNLHITSTRFDEPRCLDLVKASPQAISIHGEDSDGQVVYLGGRAMVAQRRIRESLLARGFRCGKHERAELQGIDPANICNRTRTGAGVQLELSSGLRRSFFASLSKSGRNSKTERFDQFVAAVRETLGESEPSGS